MAESFLIVLSFVSVIPVPQRFLPSWTPANLRWFCVMLPAAGVIFALSWAVLWHVLSWPGLSPILRGFLMMTATLALTGGLHLDGLMDTCDAVFSHRDRETRLRILSDTHAGSFAVMSCVIVLMSKTLLFSELFTLHTSHFTLAAIPVYSRLGMAVILNNLPFAKPGGLAVILGSSRKKRDNIYFAVIFLILSFLNMNIIPAVLILCLALHVLICVKLFGGITGDLLGAFVEASEIFMLFGVIICT